MTPAEDWKIPREAEDWECGWKGARRFSLRYFRALSIEEKIKAVESMNEVADFFNARAKTRRGAKP